MWFSNSGNYFLYYILLPNSAIQIRIDQYYELFWFFTKHLQFHKLSSFQLFYGRSTINITGKSKSSFVVIVAKIIDYILRCFSSNLFFQLQKSWIQHAQLWPLFFFILKYRVIIQGYLMFQNIGGNNDSRICSNNQYVCFAN